MAKKVPKFRTLVLILVLLLAALSLVALATHGLREEARLGHESALRSAHSKAAAQRELIATCSKVSGNDKPACISQAQSDLKVGELQNARSELNLIAQQRSALWAGIMAITAVIGGAISVLGIFLVWKTFRETRDTASIAQRNLDQYREAERPRLICEIKPPRIEGDSLIFPLKLFNIGRTTTIVSMIEWNVFKERRFPNLNWDRKLVRQLRSDDFFDYFINYLSVVEAGRSKSYGGDIEVGLGDDSKVRSGFLIGRVTFDGIDQLSHRTYFCCGFGPAVGADPLLGPFEINDLCAKFDHPRDV